MKNRENKEKKFWDKFANRYDSFINRTASKTYKEILENLNLDLNSNQNILEIGTGTGIIPFSIHSKVSSIIATDISPEMIKIAKQKQLDSNIKNIDFQVQDSYSLTLPDKSFDVVIASNLLHLLYEPEKPISEVKRVLKDNGIFIAPTFCVGEDFKSKVITTIAGFVSGFKVINKWSIDDFKKMLSANGFIIEKSIRIDGRFPLGYVIMRKK
jgi:phosphatidylethanolamine/phosphatidyl-N-methylethanolamine N-methyltransferase